MGYGKWGLRKKTGEGPGTGDGDPRRGGLSAGGGAEVLADLRQAKQPPEEPAVGAVGIDRQGVQLDEEVVHLLGAQALLPGLDGALAGQATMAPGALTCPQRLCQVLS